MCVFIFGIIGVGLVKIKEFIGKYHKNLAILVVIAILFIGAYYNVSWGLDLTENKVESPYNVLKQSGTWIKENSQPGDIIVSTARKQMLYYSEREVIDPGAYDHGAFPNSTKYRNEMIAEIKNNKNIKFLELNIVEKRPASETLYNWISDNPEIVEPIMAFNMLLGGQQTAVSVIYGFKDGR